MYLTAYIELPSVITDLRMYFLYLDESPKKQILESVTTHVTSTKKDVRLAKAQIQIDKLTYIFQKEIPPTYDNIRSYLIPLVEKSFAL